MGKAVTLLSHTRQTLSWWSDEICGPACNEERCFPAIRWGRQVKQQENLQTGDDNQDLSPADSGHIDLEKVLQVGTMGKIQASLTATKLLITEMGQVDK